MNMERFEGTFVYSRTMLETQINVISYNKFLLEVKKRLINEITEFCTKEETYRLIILLNLIKTKAEKFGIEHRLELLFEVIETSHFVTNKQENYKNEPMYLIFSRLGKAKESELEKLFDF